MFKDIVDGQVNTVIVKDLSRFGRNHIQSDDYIENILPGYNVRFISIIDEIDKALARHYHFTEEELDFIINYDIKYRMGDELN